MNDFNFDNEIIEISSDDTETTPKFEEVVEEKTKKIKKPKRSLKEKWNDLSKKNKVTIIILSVLIVLLIIGLALYFVFRKDEEEKPIEEPVILEKDNYRYEDGKLVFLDKNEKEIGTYDCSDKDTEKCYVAKLNYSNDTFDRIKSVTETGEEIEKNSQIYLDNFVFVYDKGQISLYNIATKESELELKTIKTYGTDKNLVVIEDTDSKYGLIEITEEGYEYLIRCSYDNLGIVNSNLAYLVAQDKDEHYIVDSTGKKLSKNINADISSVNDKYIVAVQNKTYNLYSFEYEELLSDYDYISLHDGVIALIKSNRLYLVNDDLNKLHEDGIRLENKDYVKKYVYDENNKLVETKKSYEIELKDNKAIITIGKDVKEINLAEGEASSKLNYMSYFDGKLYFYSDEEKDDVIGTYTCTNKNNLVNSESTLDNCSLYSNENAISGIYNNEFVFIYDNASKDDAKYYLYNIKEKKTKGTYSSIEIVNNSEMSSNIKQNYTSSSFVIAKSATGDNKGNYGVLEINSEKVAGKVGFKYESITKVKDYYLLVNIDKSYSIYNTSFKKISNEFDYIEIFDKYYVGITDNKLNVYAYDNALGILETDLSVTSNKFTIDFTNGFDITIDNVTYSYDKDGHVKEGE